MLICHLYIFYDEVSVQVFGPIFNYVGCFLIVEQLIVKNSVYFGLKTADEILALKAEGANSSSSNIVTD